MGWSTTGMVTEFLAEAGEFLHAEPARNAVILSVTENLRRRPQPDSEEPLFGWWQPGPGLTAGADDRDPNSPGAAFMHTPGFPVFLTAASSQAAAELGVLLASARPRVRGLNAQPQAAAAFAGPWRQRTGHAVTVHRRMRLWCWPSSRATLRRARLHR